MPLTFERLPSGTYVARTDLRGIDLYREPLLNKGSAFSATERQRLGLEGLLPAHTSTMGEQVSRMMGLLQRLEDPFERHQELAQLQDRNEHLFYRVLLDHLPQLMPIVYTPTVARAVQDFSRSFRRARGVYLALEHRGRMVKALRNALTNRPTRLIVLTDNESILGIGDQGAGGVEIVNGKVALYCAAAGIHPSEVAGISLDVGTDNPQLLASENYLGVRQRRLRGRDYEAVLEEVVAAIREVAPHATLQWEDLRKDNAIRVLERYRSVIPSFNDDIQGTGAVASAGVQTACRMAAVDVAAQRFVVFGAGAAGYGIVEALRQMLVLRGASNQEASAAIAVLDSQGLVESDGLGADDYKARIGWSRSRIHNLGLTKGAGLLEVVRRFNPSVLIGTSGQGGSFSREVIEALCRNCSAPTVLALSNPTDQCEASPSDVLTWSHGLARIATGSPFPSVRLGSRTISIGQSNNVFIFPAIGLAARALAPKVIPDTWFTIAANALSAAVLPPELESGLLYPAIERLPMIIEALAIEIVAAELGRGDSGDDRAQRAIESVRWDPEYPEIVYLGP